MRISVWSSDVCSSDLESEIGRLAALAEFDAHFDEESARGERPEGLVRSAVGRNERGSRCREMTVARAVVEDGPGGTALVHRVEDRVAFRVVERFDVGARDRKSTRLNSSH